MKAFRFRLDPLITLRSWEEERAREVFSAAVKKQRSLEEKLEALQSELEVGFSAWKDGAKAADRVHLWHHIESLRVRKAETAEELTSALTEREQKTRQLLQAHNRLQVLETLKGKRKEAHLVDQRRREEVELDEIVSARFQPDL